jgi:O-antigen ligase
VADVIAYIFTWLFVFAVPWENVVTIPGVGTLGKIAGLAALGATCLYVVVRGRVRRLSTFHYAAFAYLCWVVLSVLWSIAFSQSVERRVNTYLQIFAMMWVVWEATPTRARLIGLLQAYVLGAYVAALNTIYNYANHRAAGAYERFAATGFDANDLGMLLALALPMAWYIGSSAPGWIQRWLNRGYFLVGTVAILLTSSRGALLAAIVGLLVIPWTLFRLRRGVRVATVAILIAAGTVAMWYVPAFAFKRLATTTTELRQGTLNSRIRIWKAGLAVVPRRPLHGVGPAGWYTATGRPFDKVTRAPHSTYLSILVEEGLIGLLLYLAIFPVVMKRLLPLPTFERRVGLALLATLIVVLTPLGWDSYKASWLILALLASFGSGVLSVGEASGPAPAAPPARRWSARAGAPVAAK